MANASCFGLIPENSRDGLCGHPFSQHESGSGSNQGGLFLDKGTLEYFNHGEKTSVEHCQPGAVAMQIPTRRQVIASAHKDGTVSITAPQVIAPSLEAWVPERRTIVSADDKESMVSRLTQEKEGTTAILIFHSHENLPETAVAVDEWFRLYGLSPIRDVQNDYDADAEVWTFTQEEFLALAEAVLAGDQTERG